VAELEEEKGNLQLHLIDYDDLTGRISGSSISVSVRVGEVEVDVAGFKVAGKVWFGFAAHCASLQLVA